MNAPYAQPESAGGPGSRHLVIAVAAVAVALLLVAISLWRTGNSASEQACVTKVLAEYPAIPVSAYDSPRSTGSLKLSYDAERRRALKSC